MPSLRELQTAFAAALDGDTAAAARCVRGAGALDGAQALGIYRNNMRANYCAALAVSYPVVRALIGEPCFTQLAQAHIEIEASHSGDLAVFGARFAESLAAHPATQSLRYLPDVARLEWVLDVAQRAADAPFLDPASLGSVEPGDVALLRFVAHPSLRLLHGEWPALDIWRAHQHIESSARLDIAPGTYACMVLRSPVDAVCGALGLGSAEYRFIAALARDVTLGDAHAQACAIEPAFDAGAILQRHIQLGSFTAWRIEHPKGEQSQ